ncbi:c-type cytochrome [uncultured Aliiroseovarius sp.]|uniref:c-type cytochrome n=1 Tax=uncultured Aliiroseovarius sp. TaxID=1658783 RepID=UPI0026095249|nr:c-type cytochrome [uncultured Aliiroseovarius sp.]
MKHLARTFSIVCLAVVASPAAADSTFEKIKVEAGEKLYNSECRKCHAPDATGPSYGPPLENIVGRGAGVIQDYDYSTSLEASGIVWTPAALRAWMEDNDGFIPGTKMRHVGIEDRTVQDFILAYLGSITTRDNATISE